MSNPTILVDLSNPNILGVLVADTPLSAQEVAFTNLKRRTTIQLGDQPRDAICRQGALRHLKEVTTMKTMLSVHSMDMMLSKKATREQENDIGGETGCGRHATLAHTPTAIIAQIRRELERAFRGMSSVHCRSSHLHRQ